MEINITSLSQSDAPSFSGSRAELGDNAAQITWRNNVEENSALLDTPEKLEAARSHLKEYGAWSREEIAAWPDSEVNALFHQDVMSAVREAPAKLDGITFRQETDGWYHDNESTPDMETGPFESRSEAYRDTCPHREPRAECLEDIDWPEYETQAEAGRISSRLYHTPGVSPEDGDAYYFQLGI